MRGDSPAFLVMGTSFTEVIRHFEHALGRGLCKKNRCARVAFLDLAAVPVLAIDWEVSHFVELFAQVVLP